ncbi:MAG: cation diffusion facilitator family transporter [Planctomycetota bacterium]
MPLPAELRLRRHAALLSLLVGVVMLVGKSLAYWMTGSTGILSDALESVVHVLATGFAFYSVLLVARPADRRFPYGYGKIEYFSAGLEGALIFAAAVAILVEAARSLAAGPKLESLDLGVAIVGGLGLVNLLLGWYLIRTGRKTESLILVADGKHVLADAWTSLSIVAGLGVVLLTGWVVLDPLIAAAVGVHILWTAVGMLKEAVAGLMNRSDTAFLSRVQTVLADQPPPGWIEVHRLRSFPNASNAHQIDLHLTVPRYWSIAQGHAAEHELEERLQTRVEAGILCLIHLDPCTEHHCGQCRMAVCPVRGSQFVAAADWSLEALTGGPSVPPAARLELPPAPPVAGPGLPPQATNSPAPDRRAAGGKRFTPDSLPAH